MSNTILPRTLFFFAKYSSEIKNTYSCNQSRSDIRNLNPEGVNTSSHEKVNNEDSQLKKEKWYETIQNQLSHHKQDSEKEDKSNLSWIEPRIPKGRTWSI